MLNKLISHGDFKNEECLQLAVDLWSLSTKNQTSITKTHVLFNSFIEILIKLTVKNLFDMLFKERIVERIKIKASKNNEFKFTNEQTQKIIPNKINLNQLSIQLI